MYPSQADRAEARRQVIARYAQGWRQRSLRGFLRGSRPTVALGIRRFAEEQWAGLEDKSRAPPSPVRQVWLPLMIEVAPLPKRHPNAGRFRLWSLRERDAISVRTVGRVMAINQQGSKAIPQMAQQRFKKPPQPHPYKATPPHPSWVMDGRQMDFVLEGVTWWTIMLLDGDSRPRRAGAIAPSEASWVTLMVLYTACRR